MAAGPAITAPVTSVHVAEFEMLARVQLSPDSRPSSCNCAAKIGGSDIGVSLRCRRERDASLSHRRLDKAAVDDASPYTHREHLSADQAPGAVAR
jgi:hypothetical protein